MRIPALSSTLVFGTLVTLGVPAHANHKPPHAAGNQVALGTPARVERAAPSLSTGDLALTGLTGTARTPHQEPFLAATDIAALMAPHKPEIGRCYLDGIGTARRPGHLDLTLVISREGNVLSLKAAAAGMPARVTHKIETCVHAAVDDLQFPARRNDTTAVVPFFFQKTSAPDAGPRPSCWSPKGC